MREFRIGGSLGGCLLSSIVAACSTSAFGSADQFISFQGRVTDPNGTPVVNGSHLIDFFIYDAPTGGTPIGFVLNVSVVVAGGNGVVATPLGPVDAAWFSATPRYLGLTVDDNDDNPAGQELGRVPLTAVPSALVAWNLAPGAVVNATSVALTNSLNIGGSSANGQLNVQGTGNGVPVASFSQPAGTNWLDFASNVSGGNWGTILRFTNAGTTAGSIASSGNGFMAFRTPSDAVAMAIDPSGRVGVGTNAPAFKLDVRGSEADLRLQLANQSAGGHSWQFISTGAGSGVSPGSLRFYDSSATTGSPDRLTIGPTGNVGVGWEQPDTKLDVRGTGPDLQFQLYNQSPGGRSWRLISTADGSGVTAGSLRFRDETASTGLPDRFTLGPTGNVGVGWPYPDTKLDVRGNEPDVQVQINNQSAGGHSWRLISAGEGSTGFPGSFRIRDNSVGNGTDRLMITPAGRVGIGSQLPEFALDVRGAEPDLRFELGNFSPGGHEWQLISTGAGSGVAPGSLRIFDRSASGGLDRLVISPAGKVGIGATPQSNASLALGGGLAINGTLVIDATGQWAGLPTGLIGPPGPQGPQGPIGPVGPQGPVVTTAAMCVQGLDDAPSCNNICQGASKVMSDQIVGPLGGSCTAVADNGQCTASGGVQVFGWGACCVCKP